MYMYDSVDGGRAYGTLLAFLRRSGAGDLRTEYIRAFPFFLISVSPSALYGFVGRQTQHKQTIALYHVLSQSINASKPEAPLLLFVWSFVFSYNSASVHIVVHSLKVLFCCFGSLSLFVHFACPVAYGVPAVGIRLQNSE
ncbi:hypothetical protein EDB89DRAFT_1471718 [Lactarius sanguifluus]|nr:hypothetical protein EDB89DRAFT_1471718 [Lactarius sanguifluus]